MRLLLAGALLVILAGCGPPAAPAPTPAPVHSPTATATATVTLTPAPAFVSICNTGGIGAYIRMEPKGQGIIAWPEGKRLEIVGPDRTLDGEVWRSVRDDRDNNGWTKAEYLCAVSTYPTPTAGAAKPTPSPPKPSPTAAPPTILPPTPGGVEGKVVSVVDGDTIDVSIGGKTYRVRYIGIDTPETVDPRKPVECFGREASAKNRELVAGKMLRLDKDVSETDKYGRLLRYVYVGDTMINAELVRLGYAKATSYPPDVKYQALFLQLEREAREAERGLWAPDACATQAPVPLEPSQGTAPRGSVPPLPGGACPPEAPIKGNRNSMIYHVLGGQFYDTTKAEECFATEQDAVTGGYRPSLR